MWTLLLDKIFGGVTDYFKNKQKMDNALQEARILKETKIISGEIDWDVEALRQSQHSWKDEFITIIIFSPLIVAWFDSERAMEWVEFVNKLPTYYQGLMIGIVCASFGIRWWSKKMMMK